jgi:hypothetical protein
MEVGVIPIIQADTGIHGDGIQCIGIPGIIHGDILLITTILTGEVDAMVGTRPIIITIMDITIGITTIVLAVMKMLPAIGVPETQILFLAVVQVLFLQAEVLTQVEKLHQQINQEALRKDDPLLTAMNHQLVPENLQLSEQMVNQEPQQEFLLKNAEAH